jgi:hypothetical protein
MMKYTNADQKAVGVHLNTGPTICLMSIHSNFKINVIYHKHVICNRVMSHSSLVRIEMIIRIYKFSMVNK